ncbi:type II toxin-antitoxin system PemK/MazF family toxin [Kushneria aurantia]|uniref:Type II toxin-antitoxin system PemK/MazF family toxin n=1 Tax=Kushneria aurantia TaxID=504092 RepID=A0ABV6G5J5_9GAMM|nr:type II toxin-antitoxin system PemK/MazF family toxin [Kushneria aurantia]
MVAPAVGAVVLVPFPFSDLSASKLRPALVLASAGRGDWVCAQITSNPYADSSAIELGKAGYSQGSLERVSYIRPNKLFTASESLFRRNVAQVTRPIMNDTVEAVVGLLRGSV